MPNYQEIQKLSEQPTLSHRHICDEHNITPNAIQAVCRGIAGDESVEVRSSLIHGTKSPYHGTVSQLMKTPLLPLEVSLKCLPQRLC